MNQRQFLVALTIALALASAMRFAWLRADPPVTGSVGIVWHDEGAWVHNARNGALWGTWRTDNWNPMFVAPVFTVLEYAAFEALGVGTWQARIVPAVSGLAAVVCLVAALAVLGGRRTALLGGSLLAVNYGFVMWNRAALMESTMTMWMVAAWAAYALSERRPAWAAAAGAAAAAAWFTKAAAAFFVAALVLDALVTIALARQRLAISPNARRVGLVTLSGLAAAFAVAAVIFVLPNWSEYRFYNWQMSVTRKPDYTLGALADRASWIPIVQSLFSRMWIEFVAGALGLLAIAARWRTARPAERLLVLWVVLGLAELVVHDSGNERRYVMFLPAFVALGSLFIGRTLGWLAATGQPHTRSPWPAVVALSVVLAYLVAGSALRPIFRADIEAGALSTPVRLAALIAVAAGLAAAFWRARVTGWLLAPAVPRGAVLGVVVLAVASQLVQYALWTRTRATTNYDASVALGRRLPDGTLVQGKLANGLSLENRIRPLFVGNGFGNYEDRLQRDDARYILTYDLPRIGYESSDGSGLIQGILEHYPRRRVVDSFIVDETTFPDRAVLIDKFPDGDTGHARD